jgi:hypothetical protein
MKIRLYKSFPENLLTLFEEVNMKMRLYESFPENL